MNEFIDKYMKIPQQQRWALIGVLPFLVAGGYYYLFYMDAAATIVRQDSQYRKLENERAEKQAYVDNLAKYEARLIELQQGLNAARAQLPDKADVPQLLAQLGNKARQSGLKIDLFQPTGENNKGFYAEIGFTMKVGGSFHEVATFIDSISRLDRIVNAMEISLGAPKSENQKITLQSSFVIKTYRFVGN